MFRALTYTGVVLTAMFFSCSCSVVLAQQAGFSLPKNMARDKISFELVNNLVIVPVELNGTRLSFLLDTGVNTTLLFSVAENDSLQLNNAVPTKIRGLGSGGSIDVLKSENNTLKIGKATDHNHPLYVVFDETLNFSPRMGVPVHGILGYDFFKEFLVKTDYTRKKLIIYSQESLKRNPCRNCKTFDLEFHANKPFIEIQVAEANGLRKSLLLIDSGSSDALWLFRERTHLQETPKNYFQDFLGLGLSGSIYGKRSKISEIVIGNYRLTDVSTAFPDENSLRNIVFFKHREGSIGGEILKRFTVYMDYANKKMYLKKNSNFKKPFYYNMAGLTLQHDGTVTVKDVKDYRTGSLNLSQSQRNNGSVTIPISPVFNFFIAPRIIVAELRENSPAAEAGILKNDVIVTVNGKPAYKYKLHELVAMFSSKDGKVISMEIERDGETHKKKFTLRKLI